MALWANGKKWATGWLGLLLVLATATGCGQGGGSVPEGTKDEKPAVVVTPPQGSATPGQTAAAKGQPVPADMPMDQTFLEAVSLDPPEDQARPPDVTLAGKSVGKLFRMIVGDKGKGGLWEQVKFVSPKGKKLHYSATLHTDLGDLEMELYPEVAPNHVRNFVALARAGYYDGLHFDRAPREEVATAKGQVYNYIEGGCPLGTGDINYGSIGYWLHPEFSARLHHEPGSVGASHGEDPETAACKFYIALNKAEWIDGEFTIFGKITRGLDVARRIFDRPRVMVKDPATDQLVQDGTDRLDEPVTIRQVIIHVREMD